MPSSATRLRVIDTGFTPRSLPNLALWLDAASLASLADGTAVATWPDSSGQRNHATQATGANQPLLKQSIMGGQPVVRFDGTNDSLTVSDVLGFLGNVPFTIAAVFSPSVVDTAFRRLVSHEKATATREGWLFFYRSTSGYAIDRVSGGTDAIVGGVTPVVSTPVVAIASYDGGRSTVTVNGAVAAGPTVNSAAVVATATSLTVGSDNAGTNGSAGDMAALLIYGTALNQGQQARLTRWLGQRYGIVTT